MVAGMPPIKANKLRYFEDRNFKSRILPQAMVWTQEASAPPFDRPQTPQNTSSNSMPMEQGDGSGAIEFARVSPRDCEERTAHGPHGTGIDSGVEPRTDRKDTDRDKALMLDYLENNSMPGY